MMLRAAAVVVTLTLVALALCPPVAFDETLYHLPLVRAIAEEGTLRFHEELRFPVFPLLAELLAVLAYLIGGDVATHFIPLVATLLTAALLLEWGKSRGIANGPLAAAAFLGMPIVVQLATTLYVDAVLTLFVTAGFYCLWASSNLLPTAWGEGYPERRWLVLAGLCFGAACAVKYLGLYFALAGAIQARRARNLAWFAAGVVAVALPMYAWIFAQTGNPVFPFFGSSPWVLPLAPFDSIAERLVRFVRIPWDVMFARDRMGQQPPYTPFFALALLIAGWRSWIAIGYLVAFTFLPPDSRYLMPLLPLLLIEAAARVRPLPRWLVLVALLPGPAYAIYRVARYEPVPEARALQRAGTSRIYTCGGEQLKALAAGTQLGDHAGPHSFDRVLDERMHANLVALRIDMLLVAKRTCSGRLPLPGPGFTLLYEDEAAQLWRVESGREPRADRQRAR
jgi:4-amino-4-deoxy-L-arabinose transferase-like glycosyltransferase